MSRHGAKPGAGSVRGAMRPTVGRVARRRAALVGVLSLLVLCVQLALAAPAAAVPFTGGFSPTIIGERADLNGDGVVNGRDDANAFYGDTHIIDGGTVQVTAASLSAQCKATSLFQTGVTVHCFAPNGAPVDAAYSVLLGS